jgi:membrane fusion protein (multidrug efflux system)
METNNTAPKKKNKILPIMLVLIIGSSLFFGINKYRYSLSHEDTDDAQIDGDISPVYSRLVGYIDAVLFEDNQHVNKGDTLVIVDDRDLQIKVQQAEAAIANALASINVAKAAVETAKGNVVVAQSGITASNVRIWKANQDFDRFKALVTLDATTKQKFDAAKADKENAEALLESSKSQLIVAQKQVNAAQEQVAVVEAQLAQRKVELDLAHLQLSYTIILAPATGTVSKKNVQMGQLVEVKVDAFPDEKIAGKIYRFSAATGAKFSLLPPDNATGNYVKVVQRIPVKIKIEGAGDIIKKLRPGMSVKVAVELN